MKASVFVGASVDGFIARKNGNLDFLPSDGGEEHGFEEFFNSVDVLVMGRNSYDFVLDYGKWFYGKKPVYVLTNRRAELPVSKEAVVKFLRGDPEEIALILERRGFEHAYIDGGETIQKFLYAGLIQRITITRVPVLIGEGISVFGKLPHDVKLKAISTKQYETGLVQTEYKVISHTY